MRKRTTIDLEMDLVNAASGVLGTTRTTDAVHAALTEVVRRSQRMWITEFRPDLDLADLDAMRANRLADERTP